ncbi:hypothetical protein OGH69_03990 [Flavobacterium sp. MFBS3-15]|uniref:hypothetical protein n=1 Tax=Flavobacterium sp. MFBS3-15 TaxID=2989816 RepID=UPI002235CC90|nr:hypothetical protein [Flavobacterium sp. MFBS3-15]MCW4468116.1 hypothetical protein [Flavobacterium sp. MFBS3-15]
MKLLFLSTLLASAGVYQNNYNSEPQTIQHKEQLPVDECCEKTVHVRVWIGEYMMYFFGSGTARGCVESETPDNPEALELACNLATRGANAAAVRAVEESIAEYEHR